MAQSKSRGSMVDRRRFLRYTWQGVGASLSLALLPGRDLFAAKVPGTNPFALGVASGDYSPMIPHNPHIKYYEGDKRGYFTATVTSQRMELDLRFVTSVENPNGTGYTEKSFVVEDGRPGVTLY